MRHITIGNRIVGDGYPVFIIAEIGLNHNGDMKLARTLIEKAKLVGADAVKFQIFKAEELYRNTEQNFRLFKKLEFSEDQWGELRDFSAEVGILFGASVFGPWSVEVLSRINPDFFKVASCDVDNFPLLRSIAEKNKPVILSTGGSYIGEIEAALNVIYKYNQDVVLLHCVSSYPARPEEVNLKAIWTMKTVFRVPVGFSDHTIGILIPIVATAIGANVIEKHFTMNKNLPGPDHKLSLDVEEFKWMVEWIRLTEIALGDGVKRPTKSEENFRHVARRSIYSKDKIRKGEVIVKEKLAILRPRAGIEPKYLEFIIGKKARKDLDEGEPITWDAII